MMAKDVLLSIPGGAALFDWFGGIHRFHDADLLEISLESKGPSRLRIHTWQMTDKTDSRGYLVLERHVVVTINLEKISEVSLTDFNLPGIIFDLEITSVEDAFQISWNGSYGVEGTLRAKQVTLEIHPGVP